MHKPHEISSAEWREISQVAEVRDSWGIEDDETAEQLAEMAYGVKFDFASGIAPGYAGELYVLHGDALGEPMTLIRKDGHLAIA